MTTHPRRQSTALLAPGLTAILPRSLSDNEQRCTTPCLSFPSAKQASQRHNLPYQLPASADSLIPADFWASRNKARRVVCAARHRGRAQHSSLQVRGSSLSPPCSCVQGKSDTSEELVIALCCPRAPRAAHSQSIVKPRCLHLLCC